MVFGDENQNEGVAMDNWKGKLILLSKKPRDGAASGPDDIPEDVWRSLREEALTRRVI